MSLEYHIVEEDSELEFSSDDSDVEDEDEGEEPDVIYMDDSEAQGGGNAQGGKRPRSPAPERDGCKGKGSPCKSMKTTSTSSLLGTPSSKVHIPTSTLAGSSKTSVHRYTILAPEDILAFQMGEIRKVQAIIKLPATSARQLLQHYKWDAGAFLERYYISEDQKAILTAAGVAEQECSSSPVKRDMARADGTVHATCQVCFDEQPLQDMGALKCGHLFCGDCWNGYLKSQVLGEGVSTHIKCMYPKCPALADEESVQRLLKDPKARSMYIKLLINEYVKSNRHMTFCPGKDCDRAVSVECASAGGHITCQCGHSFCFACGATPHQPSTCNMVAEWTKKLADGEENENAEWFAKNTRECPKCNTVIDKDGGCQYVRCSMCRHCFCWVCMQSFDHLSHACNKFVETDTKSSRHQLNKWLHYHKRYHVHGKSKEKELILIEHADEVADVLLETFGWPGVECAFYSHGVDVLLRARTVLQDTYIYGYYLPNGVNRALFEHLQGELEQSTERLSSELEKPMNIDTEALVTNWKASITSRISNVERRLSNLLSGLEQDAIVGGKGNQDRTYDSNMKYRGFIYDPVRNTG